MENSKESAYPISHTSYDSYGKAEETWVTGGLTKREYFAAMAMQGLISNQAIFDEDVKWDKKYHGKTLSLVISEMSLEFSDELLKALDK